MINECTGIQDQLNYTIERLNRIRKELAIETDPSRKFQYETQVNMLEKEIVQLKKKYDNCFGLSQTDYKSIAEVIRNLTINTDVGEIHLVNCNRYDHLDYFWDAFEKYNDGKNPFQFYFILACPSQQPNSFSERMIYELIIEELEDEVDAINYVTETDSRRVKKEKLPFRRNFLNSQKAFKKYFSQRFNLDQGNFDFESYLETGLPQLNYKYVASVFEVNTEDWNLKTMPKYLDWLLETFDKRHKDVPTFLFFFVLNIKDLHIKLPTSLSTIEKNARQSIVNLISSNLTGRDLKVFNSILQVVQQKPQQTTLITPLLPVETGDLENWMRDLGEVNQTRIDDAIQNIVKGLKQDKKIMYSKYKKLDMTDIELFQEMVYYWVNGLR